MKVAWHGELRVSYSMLNVSTLQEPLIQIAQKASSAILDIYVNSRQYPVKIKPDHSPLTQADLMAQEIIAAGLQQLTPDIPILSEENLIPPWEERSLWQYHWLVDPLDGTQPFIQHNGEFTVNIALIHAHQPIFGLIYVPVIEECYYAYADVGARKRDATGQEFVLKTRPWQSSQPHILTSHGAKEERLKARFPNFDTFAWTKMSSAWKFCWLAEGKADISPRFGNTSEWDTAAGQCILEMAGGALLDLQGRPLRYNMQPSLINPYFIAMGDRAAWSAFVP
jgi:3'(2'), 5'-bisphosphate nucleotidase